MMTSGKTFKIEEYINIHKQRKTWVTIVTCLAAVIVFGVTYALILPAITQGSNTFQLTDGISTITFEVVDEEGKAIVGKYKNIDYEENTRYILGDNGETEEEAETNTIFANIAPVIDGYTYSGASVAGTKSDGDVVSYRGIYSVATNGYVDSCTDTSVSTFWFYTKEPLASGQYCTWGAGEYTVTLTYTEDDSIKYETVDSFYLWLKLIDLNNKTKDRYINPKWEAGKGFIGDGISDALKYTDTSGETCYLIPVSYFTTYFADNGYTFDSGSTADCPFVYAPSAYYGTSNLTSAAYIYVQEDENAGIAGGWYVQVQDKTGLDIPRSNIYLTYYGTPAAVSDFDLHLWLTGGSETIADYGSGSGVSPKGVLCYTGLDNTTATNCYLIPVDYFESAYGSYGYTFDPEDACPFTYAPNSSDTDVTAAAAYAQIEGGWYVRVFDTTAGKHTPVSNVYYTYGGSFTMTYGGSIITFYIVDHNGNPLPADCADITGVGSTKYVFGGALEQVEGEAGFVSDNFAPAVSEYTYFGAFLDSLNGSPVSSVATGGYINCNGDSVGVFQFYITEPMTSGDWYSKSGDLKVYLTYGNTVQGVTPSGTVINLFDYWRTSQDETNDFDNLLDDGINFGHALKFTPNGSGARGESANKYTGSKSVFSGIVNKLLSNGFPTLTTNSIFGDSTGTLVSGANESLGYLFDPTAAVTITDSDGNTSAYKASYRNVSGLLQEDRNGYFYYDSTKNYAEFNEDTNSFTLYDNWAVSYNGTYGQFFPFDDYSTVSQSTSAQNSSLNHYFGLTLTSRFIQQHDGYTDSTKKTAMEFEFAGDDDVWIFIDDILVADLGGIHDAASVSINFATGIVTVNGTQTTTLFEAYTAAGKSDSTEWNGSTYADNTYHTLKFYYLERGCYSSNLYLKYNLTSYPPTAIYKVDQYGDAVAGATFAVYRAAKSDTSADNMDYYYILDSVEGEEDTVYVNLSDYKYKIEPETGDIIITSVAGSNANSSYIGRTISSQYIDTTDSDGTMTFVDSDGMPYTVSELQSMFGEYFILREIAVPNGYRLIDNEVYLYFYNNSTILCDNNYESGVYTNHSLLVYAPNTLVDNTGNYIQYVTTDSEGNISTTGTLFAVVLKYIGPDNTGLTDEEITANLADMNNWAPVYGNATDGYYVLRDTSINFMSRVVEAVQQYKESNAVFSVGGSGQLYAELNGLPGDLRTYYGMMTDESMTEYVVAYYYSAAALNEDGTVDWSSVADTAVWVNGYASAGYTFTRSFGAAIEVPNLINRLYAQKTDSEGELVNGAVFGLYKVEELADDTGSDSTVYYVGTAENGDIEHIWLSPDSDGDNAGTATIRGDAASYYYSVDASTGVIYVGTAKNPTALNYIYSIKAVDTQITVAVDDPNNDSGEDGTAIFAYLSTGYYYLREICAPTGYLLNPTEVMIAVTNDAVFANAGTADDNVTVARGSGYVVSTLKTFASKGEIDNSLTWLYAQLRVTKSSSSFADISNKDDYYVYGKNASWFYTKTNSWEGDEANLADTRDDTDIITTYLIYNNDEKANTAFNYKINTDRVASGTYGNIARTRRLYTDVGWSYLEIYQDYEYGFASVDASVNYSDLRNSGTQGDGMIATLFSRTVYVRVTDENEAGTLEISKTVENADDTADSTAFSFTVVLRDSSGLNLTGSYSYMVYRKDDTKREEPISGGEIASGGTITLQNGQVAVINGIPYATRYTVTEEMNTRYSTLAVRDRDKLSADITGIDGSGPEVFTSHRVTGTLYWYVETVDGEETLDSVSTVEFTNTYLSDLLIWKESAMNGTTLSGAVFTLTKVTKNGETLYFTGKADTPWSNEIVTFTTNEYGYIKLDTSLFSSDTYELTLTEIKAPDGYYPLTDTITLTISGGKFTAARLTNAVGEDSSNVVSISEDQLSLIVKNGTGYELPMTGGRGTTFFCILGSVLLIGGSLLLVIRKKMSMKK